MQNNITFTAVLFVGGESRRMGADKATLIYEGEPLWSRQLALLKKLSPETILISARTKPAWCPSEIELVLDAPPSRGPLSGLAAALKIITSTHLLVLAVDLPWMTLAHLRWLQSQAVSGVGVMPKRRGQDEPLCAIYPMESSDLAQTALASNDFSLKLFGKTLRENNRLHDCAISETESPLYHNANTPDDFSRL